MLADTATAAKFEQDSEPKRSGEATQDPPAVAMGDTRMNSRAQGQEGLPHQSGSMAGRNGHEFRGKTAAKELRFVSRMATSLNIYFPLVPVIN